jgi:CysZ protein
MLRDFFDGIMSYGKAFKVIALGRLWSYIMIPGIISLILGGSIAYAAYLLAEDLSLNLILAYPNNWWGFDLFQAISYGVSWILLAVSGLFVYRVLLMGLVAPFMSPLAARVQEYVTGQPVYDPPFFSVTNFRLILRGIYLSLRNVSKELWFTFWLILLGFIPVFGFIAPILLFLVQAFYAGFGNLDYSLEKYYNVKDSKTFSQRYRWLAIGNGATFLTLLTVPVLGLFFAPGLSTVAATLETMKRVDVPLIDLKEAKQNDFI